jgi:hypothetical protein
MTVAAGPGEERRLAHSADPARRQARITAPQLTGAWALADSSIPSRFIQELPADHVELADDQWIVHRATVRGRPVKDPVCLPVRHTGWRRAEARRSGVNRAAWARPPVRFSKGHLSAGFAVSVCCRLAGSTTNSVRAVLPWMAPNHRRFRQGGSKIGDGQFCRRGGIAEPATPERAVRSVFGQIDLAKAG